MAKPKKAPLALQIEVETNAEWLELLSHKGLILVDVYCNWSGPCVAMIGLLRKIKMEVGGDYINYAKAQNDEINDLERFRGSSEPVWMFLENGKMILLVLGANAPRLQKAILAELKRTKQGDTPAWELPPNTRGPYEEELWQQTEAMRKKTKDKEKAEEEAEEKRKYEAFMMYMMIELSEITAIVMYPWVFKDERGNPKIKVQCAPYTDLVRDIMKQIFDVLEELRLQLTEEMILQMFVESTVDITPELIKGLTDGLCMALLVKSRPPPLDWPVPYPYICPNSEQPCPQRAINDVERYFHSLVTGKQRRMTIIHDLPEPVATGSVIGSFMERYIYAVDENNDDKDKDKNNTAYIEFDSSKTYPPIWSPFQARSKVHVCMTLFPQYIEENHRYEEPKPPSPLCAFKYRANIFNELKKSYNNYQDAVQHFGVFQFDDPLYARRIAVSPEQYEKKEKKTDTEVIVVVIRRINDEAFFAFAGIQAYFATENEEEAQKIVDEYFLAEAKGVDSKIFDYYYIAEEEEMLEEDVEENRLY